MLRLRFHDFTRATRSHTLAWPTGETATFLATTRRLLETATPMIRHRGLTLIGIAIANLDDDTAIQLPLPFDRRRPAALDTALDTLRDRFGSTSITRGILLGRDLGPSIPLLRD